MIANRRENDSRSFGIICTFPPPNLSGLHPGQSRAERLERPSRWQLKTLWHRNSRLFALPLTRQREQSSLVFPALGVVVLICQLANGCQRRRLKKVFHFAESVEDRFRSLGQSFHL